MGLMEDLSLYEKVILLVMVGALEAVTLLYLVDSRHYPRD